MKIDHIFHNLNSFGGAEEHITSLAEFQKAHGDDVSVCLIQAVTPENQYAQRLKAGGIPICQSPVWLSRLSGDWDTREAILRKAICFLSPLILIAARLLAWTSHRPRDRARASVEGRLRVVLGGFLDPARERQLFLLMLTWRYYRRKPDVLHVHSYGAGLDFVLQWAHARHLAVVYQEHSTPDLTKRRWRGLPTGLNWASVVVAVSETSAQALRQYCGVTRPIEVIPPILAINGHNEKTADSSSSSDNMVRILTIARLSEEKGLTYLLKAAERVAKVNPNTLFVIYGEGYLRENLEAQVRAAQIGPHVCLAGSFTRDDLPGIMHGANIFVLPSLSEGFPLSIVEAMAWGLPVVATRVGGVPELIQDGITGLLCPPRDEDSLAQAILTLVNRPALAQSIGAAAQDFYRISKFRPEYLGTRFSEVYAKAVEIN